MGILDQVTEMRKQGLSQEEMAMKLKEQGVSPKAINDAFSQEKIKSAVSAETGPYQGNYQEPPQENSPGNFYKPMIREQQIPGLPGDPDSYQDPYQQQEAYPQENYPEQEQYPEYNPQEPYSQESYQQPPQEYYPEPNQEYAQDPYNQGEYFQEEYNQQGYSTDTIIEVAEQVFSEKIKKIEKSVDQFSEFAALAQTKISNNNERIKRIESIIDKLQIAILEKIGSYGKDIQSIKKEMEMIEDSFTKVIPELKKKKSSSKK